MRGIVSLEREVFTQYMPQSHESVLFAACLIIGRFIATPLLKASFVDAFCPYAMNGASLRFRQSYRPQLVREVLAYGGCWTMQQMTARLILCEVADVAIKRGYNRTPIWRMRCIR